MKLTMKLIDDHDIDQRRLYRILTKKIREAICSRFGSTNNAFAEVTEEDDNGTAFNTTLKSSSSKSNTASNFFDDYDNDTMVQFESIKFEYNEIPSDYPESLLKKNNKENNDDNNNNNNGNTNKNGARIHSLTLIIQQQNDNGRSSVEDDNNNNNNNKVVVNNIPFTVTKEEGLEWNLKHIEPFARNEQRIYDIYSQKVLLVGWISPAALRVSVILVLDLISNVLLLIDVIAGAENMTAYRYTRGKSIETVHTIIILSLAFIVSCSQLYALLTTRLRTCPTLTVFNVPPLGYPSTPFGNDKGKSNNNNNNNVIDNVAIASFIAYLLVSLLLAFSSTIAWGSVIVALVYLIMVGFDDIQLSRGKDLRRHPSQYNQKKEGKNNDDDDDDAPVASVVERTMWWLELNTAFYLPFAHSSTSSVGTLIASIVDAVAELWELIGSFAGAVSGRDMIIGEQITIRPGVSEEEIMWSHMCVHGDIHIEIDLKRRQNIDDALQFQRFVSLLNLYSLDGVGSWSTLARAPSSELGLHGVGMAAISLEAKTIVPKNDAVDDEIYRTSNDDNNNEHDHDDDDIPRRYFTFGRRNYKISSNNKSVSRIIQRGTEEEEIMKTTTTTTTTTTRTTPVGSIVE